jgi:hypothetical protein
MQAITKFAVAAAAFASIGIAGSSQAAIFIGLQQAGVNGGAVTTVTSGAGSAVFAASYGTFELELITGVPGVAPSILGSTTNDTNVASTTGGTLDIYVTRDNITGPIPFKFLSTFTSNSLPAGWTVTERTFVDAANGHYGGALLASHVFNSIGTFTHLDDFVGGAGPYSVTTQYTLVAPTGGNSLNTISIHNGAVPEPGTWALMIMGFGGAGAMLRSRRRSVAAAA